MTMRMVFIVSAREEMKAAEQSLSVPRENPATISTSMSGPVVETVTKKVLSGRNMVALSQSKTRSSFEVWVLLSARHAKGADPLLVHTEAVTAEESMLSRGRREK
jgi:hypothetical protein